jgi:hypothetical protein
MKFVSNSKENLIPLDERTKEEQRKIAQQGGIASGKARRRKRSMKEAAQLILNLPAKENRRKLLKSYGIEEKDCTNLMVIMAKAIQMASDGNLKAAEFVRDTLGENPKYKIYEKKLELLVADKEASKTLIDEWVSAIPELSDDE